MVGIFGFGRKKTAQEEESQRQLEVQRTAQEERLRIQHERKLRFEQNKRDYIGRLAGVVVSGSRLPGAFTFSTNDSELEILSDILGYANKHKKQLIGEQANPLVEEYLDRVHSLAWVYDIFNSSKDRAKAICCMPHLGDGVRSLDAEIDKNCSEREKLIRKNNRVYSYVTPQRLEEINRDAARPYDDKIIELSEEVEGELQYIQTVVGFARKFESKNRNQMTRQEYMTLMHNVREAFYYFRSREAKE